MKELLEAVETYRRRQARSVHPNGTFDRAGRWHPADGERQSCCDSVRQPTRSWPNSLIKHCRSVQHVASLHSLDASDLRRAIKLIDKYPPEVFAALMKLVGIAERLNGKRLSPNRVAMLALKLGQVTSQEVAS